MLGLGWYVPIPHELVQLIFTRFHEEEFQYCGANECIVAAGWCILVEAGGLMVGGNPGDRYPKVDGRTYMAIRGAPKQQQLNIVEEFWGIIGDDKMVYDS